METVEVIYSVNDTTVTDRFTCARAAVQVFGEGRAIVTLTDGEDGGGPVSYAQYSRAFRILRRPGGAGETA